MTTDPAFLPNLKSRRYPLKDDAIVLLHDACACPRAREHRRLFKSGDFRQIRVGPVRLGSSQSRCHSVGPWGIAKTQAGDTEMAPSWRHPSRIPSVKATSSANSDFYEHAETLNPKS